MPDKSRDQRADATGERQRHSPDSHALSRGRGNPAEGAAVQAALNACGITMPTGMPPTGTPGNASQAGNTA
ncbi:hypothetical protein [Frankia sp. Cas3]|uniref:hypothetical protein n=1 Tax=Frankia sp. Cas3 TaxID=3073926 RepID=UPI002AD1FBC8|nr:hypothetical protein [Frankia sp. Cas3]